MSSLTLYPDAHPETGSFDGFVERFNITAWSSLRTASTGTTATDSLEGVSFGMGLQVGFRGEQPVGVWIARSIFSFAATALAGQSVRIAEGSSLAVLVGSIAFGNREAGFDPGFALVGATPALHNAISLSDYGVFGEVKLSDVSPLADELSTPALITFTLNTAGRAYVEAAIAADGYIAFGVREAVYDLTGDDPPYANSELFGARFSCAADATKPVLTLDYEILQDPLGPPSEINDVLHILKDSCTQSLASPTANRIRYRFARNYAQGTWDQELTLDNAVDQAALGEVVEEVIDLPWVRDAATALTVAQRRLDWLDEDAWQIELEAPLPLMLDKSLTHYVEVDHHAILGGAPLQYKIISYSTDPDTMRVKIRGIRDVS